MYLLSEKFFWTNQKFVILEIEIAAWGGILKNSDETFNTLGTMWPTGGPRYSLTRNYRKALSFAFFLGGRLNIRCHLFWIQYFIWVLYFIVMLIIKTLKTKTIYHSQNRKFLLSLLPHSLLFLAVVPVPSHSSECTVCQHCA